MFHSAARPVPSTGSWIPGRIQPMIPLRTPDRPYPKWLKGLSEENSEGFEEMLQKNGVHPKDTTDLPPERELLAEPFVPGLRKIEEKRLMRKQRPKKKRILGAEAEDRGAEDREAKKDAEEASTVRKKEPEEEKLDSVGVEKADVDGAADRGEDRSRGDKQRQKQGEKAGRGRAEERLEELLGAFRRDQFQFSKEYGSLEEAILDKPGILELYAGCRGFSRAAVEIGACWTLSFDILHHPSEDLSSPSLQKRIEGMICRGFFAAMGCAPVCASFSSAITPPCRSKEHPRGVPWRSEKQQVKNQIGNEQVAFVIRLVSEGMRQIWHEILGRESRW